MVSVTEALSIALDLHQGGQTVEAEGIYRQIIDAVPSFANAHYLLGVLCGQTGRLEESCRHLRTAVGLEPLRPDFVVNLASALFQSGDSAGAAAACVAVLEMAGVSTANGYAYMNHFLAALDLPEDYGYVLLADVDTILLPSLLRIHPKRFLVGAGWRPSRRSTATTATAATTTSAPPGTASGRWSRAAPRRRWRSPASFWRRTGRARAMAGAGGSAC